MDCKKNVYILFVWMQVFFCILDLLLFIVWREVWGVNYYFEVFWLICLVGWVVECNIFFDFCNYLSLFLYIELLLLCFGDIFFFYIGV